MTLKEASSAFAIPLAALLALVAYGSGIGHTRYGGKVMGITSADLVALLAQLREREEGARDGS